MTTVKITKSTATLLKEISKVRAKGETMGVLISNLLDKELHKYLHTHSGWAKQGDFLLVEDSETPIEITDILETDVLFGDGTRVARSGGYVWRATIVPYGVK
jgi:hypothetical protein